MRKNIESLKKPFLGVFFGLRKANKKNRSVSFYLFLKYGKKLFAFFDWLRKRSRNAKKCLKVSFKRF